MKKLLRARRGDIYVYGVLAIGLLIIPVMWLAFHMMFWEVQPVSVEAAETLGTNTTEFYAVDSFFQAFDNWAHVLGLLALGLFAFVYSQRRGREV